MPSVLSDLFTSKKFLVTMIAVLFTIAVQVLAKLGIVIDSQLVLTVNGLLGAYVVSQGVADRGKEAAKISAAAGVLNMPNADPYMHTIDLSKHFEARAKVLRANGVKVPPMDQAA